MVFFDINSCCLTMTLVTWPWFEICVKNTIAGQ